jgi:2-polyprenyl-3-methyl-5-hydroxy-6-metoxy-1,4-benzoquinol methylase
MSGQGAVRYDLEFSGADESSHSRVVRLVAAGSRVLELGAATGSMTRVLRDKGCQVTVVEIDPEAAARASAWAADTVIADLDRVALSDVVGDRGPFDFVLATDVLEHVKDPVGVLREMASLRAEGGRCVVSIPNVAHGAVRLALLDGRWEYAETGLLDRTHIRFFTEAGVAELFRDAGLEIDHTEYVERDLTDAEVPFDAALLDTEAARRVAEDPLARVFQFVVRSTPRTGADAPPRPREVERPALADEQVRLLRYQALRLRALDEYFARHYGEVDAANAATAAAEWRAGEAEAAAGALREHVAGVEARAAGLEAHARNLEAALAKVTGSKVWRTADRLRRWRGKVGGR